MTTTLRAARITWLALITAAALAATAQAAPATAIASCGDSSFEIAPASSAGPAKLHAVVVTAGTRWRFSASIGLVRFGARTATITVEDLTTDERSPRADKQPAPSSLFIDVFVPDKKLILRHASEGDPDPAYAADLDKCSWPPDGAALLSALVPAPPEPVGCAPEVVRGRYKTQVSQVQGLADADAEREARALCEDHQNTIKARIALEATISDRAARDRIAARGSALQRSEETRMKTWNRIDGCLGAALSREHGVAALHDSEAKLRTCYAQIAAKP